MTSSPSSTSGMKSYSSASAGRRARSRIPGSRRDASVCRSIVRLTVRCSAAAGGARQGRRCQSSIRAALLKSCLSAGTRRRLVFTSRPCISSAARISLGDAVQPDGDRRAQRSQARRRARRRRRCGWSCIRHLTCKARPRSDAPRTRASAAAFESSRYYLYLVDTRGQKWTDANNLAPALRERGVSNDGYQITRAFPNKKGAVTTTPILAQEATAKAVWIPRASCSS